MIQTHVRHVIQIRRLRLAPIPKTSEGNVSCKWFDVHWKQFVNTSIEHKLHEAPFFVVIFVFSEYILGLICLEAQLFTTEYLKVHKS